MAFYPLWRRQFRRLEAKARNWGWHRAMLDGAKRNEIKDRIAREGPLSTFAFESKGTKRTRGLETPAAQTGPRLHVVCR